MALNDPIEAMRNALQPLIDDNDKRSKYDAGVYLSLFKQFIYEPATIEWSAMKPLAKHVDYEQLCANHIAKTDNINEVLKHLCVIKLNGGLGTTMGLQSPKSLIHIRDGMSFLDFAIHQNKSFNEKYGSDVPLILMNSFNTEQPTEDYLMKHNIHLRSFQQSKCPRINAQTLLPLPKNANDRATDGWYPPGHGNIFESMNYTGILDELISQGREICFISNTDNTRAVADVNIARFMLNSGTEYAMECIDRSPADIKGGTLIEIYGKLMHLEMSQVPKDKIDEFCSTRTFKTFNTNNIWVNLKSVKKCLSKMKMEIIVNKKKLSTGEDIIQLETSIGGAIRNFDKAISIKVSRSRFLPIKKTQDLLAIMSDMYEMTDEYQLRMRFNQAIPIPPSIKLSSEFDKMDEFKKRFKSIPSLVDIIRMKVDGDVYFGHDIVLKGDVIIIADEGQKLEIPSHSFIENKLVRGRLSFKDNF